MKFKYFQYPVEGNKSVYRPSVPIVFKKGKKMVWISAAIIDSGSDYIILPIELAGELGIKIDPKKRMDFYAAGGNSFPVYPAGTEVEYILRQNGFRPIRRETEVYFAESQSGILLGNIGFLDCFKVVLNGLKKELELSV